MQNDERPLPTDWAFENEAFSIHPCADGGFAVLHMRDGDTFAKVEVVATSWRAQARMVELYEEALSERRTRAA